MGSPERLTRQQYKEIHSIKELPDLIEGALLDETEISDTPFYRIRLTNGFSLLLPVATNGLKRFEKGDRLSVHRYQGSFMAIDILRRGRLIKGPTIDETQVIPDDHWEKESLLLIEDSKNNTESSRERDRWERYRRKLSKPSIDPDWFAKLERAVSPGALGARGTNDKD